MLPLRLSSLFPLARQAFKYNPHSRLSRYSLSPTFITTSNPARTMSTIKLNDGNSIPTLAIGTGTALYNKDATNAIAVAIQSGFTHLDTAQMYNNEASVGDGIIKSKHDRSQLYVTTKLGKLPAGTSVEESLKESLGKLKLEYVDLFLIHNPVDHPDLKSLWKEFEGVKEKGLTKSIGVSNFQPKHLNEILEVATVPPAVNQVRLQSPLRIHTV